MHSVQFSGYHAQLLTLRTGLDSRLGSERVMQYAGTRKEMHEAGGGFRGDASLRPEGIAIT